VFTPHSESGAELHISNASHVRFERVRERASERARERERERKEKRKEHEKGFFLYTIESRTTHYHIGKEKKKKTCSLFTALAC